MNNDQLAKVSTLDRYEQDVEDWAVQLEQIRGAIDYAENTGDIANGAMSARKTIADLLGEIEQARHFITVKRHAIPQETYVSTSFENDPSETQIDVLREDLHSQDEGTDR